MKRRMFDVLIFFPAADSPAVAGADFAPMRAYAGQQLTTGAQAETDADHFIAIAGMVAIAAFVAALVMGMLGGLGLRHARRVPPATDVVTGHPKGEPVPAGL